MNSTISELEKIRHSAAHLLAHAVLELYPQTQLTIGPATKEGFFYDFLPEKNFKEEDLPIITQRMKEIVAQNIPLTHEQITKDQARLLYYHNPFKLELIDQIPGDTVGIARQGSFFDLCKGGHVDSTGQLEHFELLSISGSYWRADKTGKSLQRITGTAFANAQELQNFKQKKEDAQKYDHRKIGKQLDLFSFHDQGPGFPFFHPKGTTILQIFTEYLRNLLHQAGYVEIKTPTMLSADLWKQSGHYTHYKDNMYFCIIEDREFAIKPMNCPGSILIYKERPRSYRELPLRLSELGQVHRYELSGVLHGLFRTRAFTIDDGHIFCTPDQLEQEVLSTVQMIQKVLQKFGFFELQVGVSTRPEKSLGSDSLWKKATQALKSALEKAGLPYTIHEGEGAFYGPKIEFLIKDSMDREWQCGTVQVDFVQPENFDVSYITHHGQKERPVIIHRAIYGSFERFFAIILEHYKGNLPFWLAPVQATVLTITDTQKPYARTILEQLKDILRITIDESSDPLSGKIKRAQHEKIPWMIIIGKKEMEQNHITVRFADGTQKADLTIEQLVTLIEQ